MQSPYAQPTGVNVAIHTRHRAAAYQSHPNLHFVWCQRFGFIIIFLFHTHQYLTVETGKLIMFNCCFIYECI